MSVAKLKPQTRQLYLLQGGGGVAHVLPGMVETQLSAMCVFNFRHCPVVQGRKIKMSLFLVPVLWCCGVARRWCVRVLVWCRRLALLVLWPACGPVLWWRAGVRWCGGPCAEVV